MAPITPERHMKLLNMAWNRGVDRVVLERFVLDNMRQSLDTARVMKNDDFVAGYEAAFKHVKHLLGCSITFAQVAEIMNGSFPDVPEDFVDEGGPNA